MKRPRGIEVDDLLSEIAALSFKPSDPGLTFDEIKEKSGRGQNVVLGWLRLAKAQGRLEVGHRQMTRIDGRRCPVPVYRVLPAGKGSTAGRARRAGRDTPQGGSNGASR
jgi:hypothetical protein